MKIKIYLHTLLMSGVLLLSCQKEENSPIKDEKPSQVDDNYLSFKDRNAFETAINSKDLKSLRTANFKSLKESTNNLGIDNEFMLSILSPGGEVQIGQWLFKLNGFDQTVKVLDPTTKAVTGNFTFDDDVLDLLENGITSTPSSNQRINLFCGEKGVSKSYDDEPGDRNFHTIHYPNHANVDAATVTNYTKLGVYFELRIKWGVMYMGIYGDPYNYYHSIYKEYKYKAKCKSEHHEAAQDNSADYPDYLSIVNATGYGVNDKVYASTTALAKYWSHMEFSFYSYGTESFQHEVNHGY